MTPDSETKQLLQMTALLRREASVEYYKAILRARNEGWAYTDIARVVGVSEGAVRLLVKRRKEKAAR